MILSFCLSCESLVSFKIRNCVVIIKQKKEDGQSIVTHETGPAHCFNGSLSKLKATKGPIVNHNQYPAGVETWFLVLLKLREHGSI